MTAPGVASDLPTGPRHPRNPWYGFLYAAILLVGAVGGFVMLAFGWREALAGDMVGQRTEGFVLFAPVLTAAGGILILVRAILAVGPWVRHRTTTPRDDRLLALSHDRSTARGGVVAAFVVGGLTLAGFVLLAGFARPNHVMGAGLLVQFDALLLFAAAVCLKAAGQAVWANGYLAERGLRS